MNITRVTPVGRPPGTLRCPQCGWRLGESTDPHTGYLTHCNGCKVALVVRIDGPTILVSVKRHDEGTTA